MYITFDFKCGTCGDVQSRFVKREEIDKQLCACQTITPMTRLPAGTRTTFRYADTKLKD
jgi:hypothetical protein